MTARPAPPRAYRWLVLVFISLAMFGNYYVYDCISPMADVLKARLGFTDANIGLLQAIYSIPNVVMVLIGGFIIDRIGTRKATLIFGVICLAGAVVTSLSGTLAAMAAGRLLFGLGAESLIVAVTTAIAKWFKGKELSFAFGINLTIARLGSFAALNSPSWASWAYRRLAHAAAHQRGVRHVLRDRRDPLLGARVGAERKYTLAPRDPPTRWCSATSSGSGGPTGASWRSASRSTRGSSRSRPSP